MSNSRAGRGDPDRPGLRPGQSPEGTVDIENTGSLSGDFSLARGTVTNTDATNPLAGKLNVVVDDCGTFTVAVAPACGDGDDVNKYTGTIADMGTTGHTVAGLGTFGGGDKHRYRFRVTLDRSAGNHYQGDSSTVGSPGTPRSDGPPLRGNQHDGPPRLSRVHLATARRRACCSVP